MTLKCPFLLVPENELEKVKPEFRAQVKADAEKCIEGECPSFIGNKCLHPHTGIDKLTIGGEPARGIYYPDPRMLV